MTELIQSARGWLVRGHVTFAESGAPAAGVTVTAMDADWMFDDKLGEDTTDARGAFSIGYGPAQFRDVVERAPDVYLVVRDADGVLLATTRDAVVRNAPRSQEIGVQIPGAGSEPAPSRMVVGATPVDRLAWERLQPDDVVSIADFAIQGRGSAQITHLIEQLNPELLPERMRRNLCFTPLVHFLREAVVLKAWPREVALRLEEILIGYDPAAAYATQSCSGHFTITYQDTGSDQPPAGDSGVNIVMPGTGAVVGATTANNGVPDYIEKLCFWLENAWTTYTAPPFSLRDPAVNGPIPVNVTGTAPGFAGGGSMTIGRNLNDDLLAAVPTHELMHLIQERYRTAGSGAWDAGITEGGAVLGEDVVFDTHNRYVVQATQSGTLAHPEVSLNSAGPAERYYLAMFLKYVSEQQSPHVNPADEPAIGVETYRTLLEAFDALGYSDAAFVQAVSDLPWYQSFYEIYYMDPARLDETCSETLLGNFWLACYLKDFGTGTPDRRFDFMEDEENATWDTIFTGGNSVGTLGPVALTSTSALAAGGSLTLSSGAGSVSPFAARLYRVNPAAAVDTLRVNFTAGAGFTRPLVQVVLVEPGNVVRDILRSDRTSWQRTIANARGGVPLDHVLVVVAGTDTGGTFSLVVNEVPPAPDVMVTRWHHLPGRGYEIDSFNYAWTWTSPDIWVDNDNNGVADSDVYFNQNNRLVVRLRNQGHANASGIGVQFWYQDATPGLHDGGWTPVKDVLGNVQTLSGLTLAAGATNTWSVNWAPVPSGASHHFCVRVAVTVPGDPNTDNKRLLSNFSNLHAYAYHHFDLSLLRRAVASSNVHVHLIPRTGGRWFVSAEDLARAERTPAAPGRPVLDEFRIRRRARLAAPTPTVDEGRPAVDECGCRKTVPSVRGSRSPDPFGHYPTDPRALPPGVGDAPLITVAHVENGRVVGGFTWAIREEPNADDK